MAVRATGGRLRVRYGFAGCLATVVARGAVAADGGVIKTDHRPFLNRVTILAIVAGSDVGRRLALRGDAVMAGGAGFRRAAEDAFDMAACALHALVAAGERKACFHMIESRRRPRRRRVGRPSVRGAERRRNGEQDAIEQESNET